MVSAKLITVEVVYAKTSEQKIISLQVEEGMMLERIIRLSGILDIYPEIDLAKQKIGVFGKRAKLTDIAQHGDRIEIYRPLVLDPKEARRRRANESGRFL